MERVEAVMLAINNEMQDVNESGHPIIGPITLRRMAQAAIREADKTYPISNKTKV